MAESPITRRHALCIAGALLTVGCSSDQQESKATINTNTDSDVSAVSDAWRRIHNWLSANAPRIIGNLNPPASDNTIREAERQFGHEMPEEWRDLYRGHNGMNSDSNMGSLFYGMQFLSLDQAVSDQKNNSAPAEDTIRVRAADSAIRKEDIYNSKWIAIAHDGGDMLIRVDMDPAPSGNTGQVIFTDHADDTVILLGKSVAQFMSGFARDLEAGRYSLDKDALAEGDQFLNCEPEIDVINWAHSARWKHLAQ